MFKVMIGALGLLLWGNSAVADGFKTGNDLFASCTAQNRSTCIAYVEGIVDMAMSYQNSMGAKKVLCVPMDVTAEQASDIVTAYLRAHPERRHLTGSGLSWLALVDAWPCS